MTNYVMRVESGATAADMKHKNADAGTPNDQREFLRWDELLTYAQLEAMMIPDSHPVSSFVRHSHNDIKEDGDVFTDDEKIGIMQVFFDEYKRLTDAGESGPYANFMAERARLVAFNTQYLQKTGHYRGS